MTVAAWAAFLEDLRRTHGEEAALARAPREINAGEQPRVLARWREGQLEISGDGWHSVWPSSWPVTLIDQGDALAYTDWLARRTGQPWRLPPEQEWEPAGRGADGRVYAWGDHLEAGWACNALTGAGPPSRADVGAYPTDESPLGVQDLCGNVREWCSSPWTPPAGNAPAAEPFVVIRGGSWTSAPTMCRLAMRFAGRPTDRLTSLGMRLARSVLR